MWLGLLSQDEGRCGDTKKLWVFILFFWTTFFEQQWKIFHGAAIEAKIEAARSSAKGEVTASSIAGQEMS